MAAIIDACFSKQQLQGGDPNPASMDLSHSQEQPQQPAPPAPAPTTQTATQKEVLKQRKRTSPGYRVLRGRIYDPENGKSCHQCRQKTTDFAAECTNLKKENKVCTMKYCHKCLLNRYGEKAEEVAALGAWKCPKCRDICNCSLCMKKRGCRPTGILSHKAKATGFSSVSEFLQLQGPVNESQDPIAVSPCKQEKEPALDGNPSTNIHPQLLDLCFGEKKPKKAKGEGLIKMGDSESWDPILREPGITDSSPLHFDIQLPQGTEITNVAGMDFPSKDVGNALQFLEFCATFREFLGLREGQPESLLRDIMCGSSGQNGAFSSVIQFQIQLLALLEKDLGEKSPSLNPTDGENSWLHSLKKCVSESSCELRDIPLDFIERGVDEYEMLDYSQKLRLLAFLCDEALGTMDMRNWMDSQILKFAEQKKEAKGVLAAAKDKEKLMKQKLDDEIARAILAQNSAPVAISEHDSTVSEIKAEVERAHAEIVKAGGLVPKRKQRSDALRTEPIALDAKGHAYWRLKAYNNSDLVLQDMGHGDKGTCDEKWFSFDGEEKTVIEKYISASRVKRGRRRIDADSHNMENINCDTLGKISDGDDLPPSAIVSEGVSEMLHPATLS